MAQVLTVQGKCNLTRSQSDKLIVEMMMMQPFVVAHWHKGEPIIHGFGATSWAARNRARIVGAPEEAELCAHVIGETLVWQGPSGRRVTVEDLLTVDD